MRTEHTGTGGLKMAEELTDDELRRQLQAYGVDKLGPITETTRAIYIKRLNHYRAAERKANRGGGRSQRGRKLAAFSSDESEEESLEPEQPENRVNSRRRSSRAASRTAAPTATVSNFSTTRRRSGRGRPNSNSTTDAKERGDRHDHGHGVVGRRSLGTRSYDDFDSSDANDQDDDEVDHQPTGGPDMVSRSINTSSFLDSSFLDRTYNTHDTSVREHQRSRSSLGRDRGLRPHSSLASPLSSPNSLNYRSPPKGNHLTPGGQSLDEKFRKRYSNNLNSAGHDRSYFSEEEEKIKQDGFKTDEDSSWLSEGFDTSRAVLVSGVLFFLALALVYVGISFNSSHPFGSIGTVPYPEIESENDQLLFHIFEVVSRHGGGECGQGNNRMKIDEVVTQLCGEEASPQCNRRDVRNALKKQQKYFNDTDLPIKLLTSSGGVTAVFEEAEYISAPPRLTMWCRLITSAHKVAFYFLLGILVLGAIYVVVKSVQYYKRKKDEETQRVIELVEKIINILASHHEESVRRQDNREFVAISHVRDILIPIQQRKKMQPLWDKAVKFLSANESRVRVETQKIHGEEFAVWRWLPMHFCANGGKVWQGQAFGEHKELALNSAPYSYTPCLKIRNMFDSESEWEEDWHVRIQDAILEKCSDEHGIVHIAVDKSSKEGCVFVKCVSNVYSGKAYKALHGWWFNGKLVTVKYLRLERYHERFPDAKHCSEPMQPSNNQCLSLSQPFHRSVIEFS